MRNQGASTSVWLTNTTHPEAIREIIQAYGEVVDNLNSHVNPEAQYQNASTLLDMVTSGPTVGLFLGLHRDRSH